MRKELTRVCVCLNAQSEINFGGLKVSGDFSFSFDDDYLIGLEILEEDGEKLMMISRDYMRTGRFIVFSQISVNNITDIYVKDESIWDHTKKKFLTKRL